MLSYIFLVTTLFWVAPTIVVISKAWWNIMWWQNRNYRVYNLVDNWLESLRHQHESKLTLLIKINAVIFASSGFLHPGNILSQIGVFLFIAMWFTQALLYFNQCRQELWANFLPRYRSVFTLNLFLLILSGLLILNVNFVFGAEFLTNPTFGQGSPMTLFEIARVNIIQSDPLIVWEFVYTSAIVLGALDVFNFLLIGLLSWMVVPIVRLLENTAIMRAKRILAQAKNAQVILVTGDKGKSATAKILRQILGNSRKVAISNHSIARAEEVAWFINTNVFDHTEFVIIELSDWIGREIDRIKGLVQADMMIITSIDGDAAINHSKSQTDLIAAKYKLTQLLSDSGTLFLNADDLLERKLAKQTQLQEVFFSAHDKATISKKNALTVDVITTESLEINDDYSVLSLDTMAGQHRIEIGYDVRRLKHSHLAAIAAALSLNIPIEQISQNLADFNLDPYQLEHIDIHPQIELLLSHSRINLTSLRHDLQHLKQHKPRRTIFVCPDLSLESHYSTGNYLHLADTINESTDILITYDQKLAKIMTAELKTETFLVRNTKAVINNLELQLDKNETILLPSSIEPNVVKYLIDK